MGNPGHLCLTHSACSPINTSFLATFGRFWALHPMRNHIEMSIPVCGMAISVRGMAISVRGMDVPVCEMGSPVHGMDVRVRGMVGPVRGMAVPVHKTAVSVCKMSVPVGGMSVPARRFRAGLPKIVTMSELASTGCVTDCAFCRTPAL